MNEKIANNLKGIIVIDDFYIYRLFSAKVAQEYRKGGNRSII